MQWSYYDFAQQHHYTERPGPDGDTRPESTRPGNPRRRPGDSRLCLLSGTADCLRDEAIDLATRLCRAGIFTELHVYAGAVHGFDMFANCAVVRCAAHDSADWLARQFR
jgi:acetyl esterase/lipase